MIHNVFNFMYKVNNMDQDVALGVTLTTTQSQLSGLRAENRLGEFAVIYRVKRLNQGGGFGNNEMHPFAWAVLVYIDGSVARIYSARGEPREWNSLDRLEIWLRGQGFYYWWTRNDLEVLGQGETPDAEDYGEWPFHPFEN